MDRIAKTFKALSDESRLRILGIILRAGELCVCDIERVMGFTQTKVSRHLSYLKNAGLLQDRRQGLWMLYRISAAATAEDRMALELVRSIAASNPVAREDVRRLEESVEDGCCTTFTTIKPGERLEAEAAFEIIPAGPASRREEGPATREEKS